MNFGSNPFRRLGEPGKSGVIETCFSGDSDVMRAAISDPACGSRIAGARLKITAQPALQNRNDPSRKR